MSHAPIDATSPIPLQQITHLMEERVPAVVERAAARIQREVPGFGGPTDGRRRQLIDAAMTQACGYYVRRLSGRRTSSQSIDDLFRRMAYAESRERDGVQHLVDAVGIGAREAWTEVRDLCVELDLPAASLAKFTDDLVAWLDHLTAQIHTGAEMAARATTHDAATMREQLFDSMVAAEPAERVRARAARAGWPVPVRSVVVAVEVPPEAERSVADVVPESVLQRTESAVTTLVIDAEQAEQMVDHVRRLGEGNAIAKSWPVAVEDLGAAVGWTRRALALAEERVIPRQPVIDCARYRTQLWLHSEPALRRLLAQELLSPLISETPNSREILSDTLLVWLETRESAPAIAAILGVHPQTVRYRWRRINEIFGESLHDSEFVVQLTMVLKASLPLWKAGDQSDFERYRAGGAT